MQVRRLFVSDTTPPVRLSNEESHYALRVLRLQAGHLVELITPAGCVSARIERTQPELELTVLSEPEMIHEPSLPITLFQGLPDSLDKLELIVQKAVELGVSRIVPFHSRHTNAKYRKMPLERKLARLQKISREAVRQCRRSRVPQVTDPVELPDIVTDPDRPETVFLFYEQRVDPPRELVQPPASAGIVIGPEGGFAEHEIDQLIRAGCHPVHLPGRTLRTETAALACLTLIQARYGDYRMVP